MLEWRGVQQDAGTEMSDRLLKHRILGDSSLADDADRPAISTSGHTNPSTRRTQDPDSDDTKIALTDLRMRMRQSQPFWPCLKIMLLLALSLDALSVLVALPGWLDVGWLAVLRRIGGTMLWCSEACTLSWFLCCTIAEVAGCLGLCKLTFSALAIPLVRI